MSSLANQKGVLHGDAVQELFEIAKKKLDDVGCGFC